MKKRFLRISAYLLASLAIIFAVSFAQAGDSTSFNPTAVTVKVDAISGVPIGSVIPWPSSTPPRDYLECNGQSFSSSQYPKLASILGSTRVPNYQNEFLRGASASRAVGSKQGESMGTLSGSVSLPAASHMGHGGNDKGGSVLAIHPRANGGSRSFSISIRGGSETRPRNIAVMYIIRAK